MRANTTVQGTLRDKAAPLTLNIRRSAFHKTAVPLRVASAAWIMADRGAKEVESQSMILTGCRLLTEVNSRQMIDGWCYLGAALTEETKCSRYWRMAGLALNGLPIAFWSSMRGGWRGRRC